MTSYARIDANDDNEWLRQDYEIERDEAREEAEYFARLEYEMDAEDMRREREAADNINGSAGQ